ncbi:MAG: leucine-rich repeat domain-containing protein, partial [Bacteroidales bacterium]|nr:leucine-rich repeat domain-containing protein [Bacteroidales bacterium]
MRKLFLIMAFALVGLSAKAYDFSAVNDDGKTIYYKITSATAPRTVAVTYDVNGTYSGSVVIPSSVANNGNTYSVTSMGNWTFQYCARLTSVTIGNSVMSIGELCFSSCSGLTSVTIGNSVTSIGEDAFRYCHGLTSVTIPNSVTSIGNAAFGCCGLQNIINNSPNFKFASAASVGTAQVLLPVSHTSDDFNYAADNPVGCLATGQLTIPNSVMAIGESAFRQCSGLTSVTIGNSVASIGRSAFFQCSGLTSVNIPNSVTSIGDWAFSDCSGFTSVTIGNSVTSIGEHAFYF